MAGTLSVAFKLASVVWANMSQLPLTPEGIYFLGTYRPYRMEDGSVNPNFDKAFSGRVLDVKDGETRGIDHFTPLLETIVPANVAVASMPSSDAATTTNGIRRVAQIVAQTKGRIDATACLVRHTSIPKAATGGPREVQMHLDSIRVDHRELIHGRQVVVLDDITTSGASLVAARTLLMQVGAAGVAPLALAKTGDR